MLPAENFATSRSLLLYLANMKIDRIRKIPLNTAIFKKLKLMPESERMLQS